VSESDSRLFDTALSMAVPPYEVMESEKLRTWESFSVGEIAAVMNGLAIERARWLYYSRENSITGANVEEKNGNRLKLQAYPFSVAPMMDWNGAPGDRQETEGASPSR
jgi:hypothetical protein